jgi:hypothetical protein
MLPLEKELETELSCCCSKRKYHVASSGTPFSDDVSKLTAAL